MAYVDEAIDFTLLDEITRLLTKNDWISSYELFYQVVEKLEGNITSIGLTESEIYLQKKNNTGIALRAISNSRKLFELSLGISSLHMLANLSEPKSTQKDSTNLKFPILRPPRILSVPGDFSKSVSFNEDTVIDKIIETTTDLSHQRIEENSASLTLERETRYIINTGSKGISSSSLKVQFENEIKVKGDNFSYSLNRESYRRNLNFNVRQMSEEFDEVIENRSSPPVAADLDKASVIFHPEIIGKIIAFQSNSLISSPINRYNPIWKDNIYLYDDPLREEGYSSILFDDEGNLTGSKVLVEKGEFKDSLHTISTSTSRIGGNGYRSAWFQPINRSYEYPITRSITNLVMTGGIGKGKNFTEKNTISLVVLRGHGYIGGMANNPKFVIHAKETEIWQNGECLGQSYNYTFSGSLNEIMRVGDLSADQIQVVDKAIPGAVYIGWLRCPAGIVKIG
ncbi:MAG: metallopeptidase TldD-related protein [Candidatus Kariarchaeaceae archaeon]|jgi:predicted Zn-dependent protease